MARYLNVKDTQSLAQLLDREGEWSNYSYYSCANATLDNAKLLSDFYSTRKNGFSILSTTNKTS
jgi:hypothetical protein